MYRQYIKSLVKCDKNDNWWWGQIIEPSQKSETRMTANVVKQDPNT